MEDISDRLFASRTRCGQAPVPRNFIPPSHTALRKNLDFTPQGMDAKTMSQRANDYTQAKTLSRAAPNSSQTNNRSTVMKYTQWSK